MQHVCICTQFIFSIIHFKTYYLAPQLYQIFQWLFKTTTVPEEAGESTPYRANKKINYGKKQQKKKKGYYQHKFCIKEINSDHERVLVHNHALIVVILLYFSQGKMLKPKTWSCISNGEFIEEDRKGIRRAILIIIIIINTVWVVNISSHLHFYVEKMLQELVSTALSIWEDLEALIEETGSILCTRWRKIKRLLVDFAPMIITGLMIPLLSTQETKFYQ